MKKAWIIRYALQHSGKWSFSDIARATSKRTGKACSVGYVRRALREAGRDGKIVVHLG